MDFELIHKDARGVITTSFFKMYLLGFIKHATFAGMNSQIYHNYYHYLHHAFRYLSLFYEFYPSFIPGYHFKLLKSLSRDPTETAYLSNKIGRAVADYLSKNKYGARFTHCYEDAMRIKGIPIAGQRPDFYCENLREQFSVEAKGFSSKSVSDYAMRKHKTQSGTGPLLVNFSVASVAYNLYQSPKVKFYDPIKDGVPYDADLNSKLRDEYYRSALKFIRYISEEPKESGLADYISYRHSISGFSAIKFLVHRVIHDGKWETGEQFSSTEYLAEHYQNEDIYIDVDGIGIMWSTW